jgi:hypothetical protein
MKSIDITVKSQQHVMHMIKSTPEKYRAKEVNGVMNTKQQQHSHKQIYSLGMV